MNTPGERLRLLMDVEEHAYRAAMAGCEARDHGVPDRVIDAALARAAERVYADREPLRAVIEAQRLMEEQS